MSYKKVTLLIFAYPKFLPVFIKYRKYFKQQQA